jgi:hypothetical protein
MRTEESSLVVEGDDRQATLDRLIVALYLEEKTQSSTSIPQHSAQDTRNGTNRAGLTLQNAMVQQTLAHRRCNSYAIEKQQQIEGRPYVDP